MPNDKSLPKSHSKRSLQIFFFCYERFECDSGKDLSLFLEYKIIIPEEVINE